MVPVLQTAYLSWVENYVQVLRMSFAVAMLLLSAPTAVASTLPLARTLAGGFRLETFVLHHGIPVFQV